MKQCTQEQKTRLLLGLILAVAALARFAFLAQTPGGFNQDEAYAGYEAYSLLHYGVDSHGYAFPVYFVSWGSGMNVLYSYLSMPFIAILGLTVTAVRLPQAVFGFCTVVLAYFFGKQLRGPGTGLWFAGLLAVMPWHVMLSRWGLESNLVVFFLAAGLLFYLKGLRQNRWWLLSALFYGLSLYCYATNWLVVPVLAMLLGVYALRTKAVRSPGCAAGAVLVLALLAMPLLAFLAVNYGLLPEVRTPFFSIPSLAALRSMYSLAAAPQNLKAFFTLLLTQSDGLSYNALPGFGLYYPFSLPFILYGIGAIAADARKGERKPLVLLLWLAAVLPTALLMQAPNINRINVVHLPLILCCAYGLQKLAGYIPHGRAAFAALYAAAFAAFCIAYFGPGAGTPFYSGYREALALADAAEKTVYVSDLNYSLVLFETEYPAPEFAAGVEYANYPSPWLKVYGFGKYRFDADPAVPDETAVYLCWYGSDTLLPALQQAGFTVTRAGNYCVAQME